MQNSAAHLPKADIIREVQADQSGFIAQIDAKQVGMGVVVLGGGRKAPGRRARLRRWFRPVGAFGVQESNKARPSRAYMQMMLHWPMKPKRA